MHIWQGGPVACSADCGMGLVPILPLCLIVTPSKFTTIVLCQSSSCACAHATTKGLAGWCVHGNLSMATCHKSACRPLNVVLAFNYNAEGITLWGLKCSAVGIVSEV